MVAYRLTLKLAPAATEKAAGDMAYREVTTVVRQAFNRANVLTPVDTGNLRAGNQMRVRRVGNTTTGQIFNEINYAPPVHDGSKAYTIVPKTKKALRFVINGEVVFATKVTMPPRKGRPWIYRAVREIAAQRGYTFSPGP